MKHILKKALNAAHVHHLFLAIVALILPGCSHRDYHEQRLPATIMTPSGEPMCRVHGFYLKNLDGYEFDYRNLIHASTERLAFEKGCPNPIPIGFSRVKSRDFPTPGKTPYCPECQRQLEGNNELSPTPPLRPLPSPSR